MSVGSEFGSISYGGSSLLLVEYSAREEAVVKDGLRTGTNVTVTAECELVCANASDFATQLAAAQANLSIDERDLVILGLNGLTEYNILQARAQAGPFVNYEMLTEPPAGPFSKAFRVTVKSLQYPANADASGHTNTFKVAIKTRPDNTRVITYSGDIIGPNSADYFTGKVLPVLLGRYPLPNFVVDYSINSTQDKNLSQTGYTVQAIDLAGALPVAAGGSAVDGEITKRSERDEHYRLVTMLEVDVLIDRRSDPQKLIQSLRANLTAGPPAAVILRENWQVTTIQQIKIRASFTVLSSADKSPLLNFTQTISVSPGDGPWQVHTYPGASPIVVQEPQTIPRITQSGSATAIGKFFHAPAPLMTSFLELPEVSENHLNDIEKQTTWHYVMYAAAAQNQPDLGFTLDKFNADPLSRPAQEKSYYPGGK